MFTVPSNFVGSFKLGDNISYNCRVLCTLYRLRAAGDAQTKRHLQKLITILNVSIIDAVLHDFYSRVRTHTREGVANVAAAVIAEWRGTAIDRLERFITQAKKHDLFGQPDDFYDDLHTLRKLRNRIHIQNEKKDFEPDDYQAFTEARMVLSEKAVEKVLTHMAAHHARVHDYVADFQLPWDRHFP